MITFAPLPVAAVQFEHRDGDKSYNLGRIAQIAAEAKEAGARVVSFHECSVSAYSFVQPYTKEQLWDLAEPVPDGSSVQQLIAIADDLGIHLLAGLFEREDDRIYNSYVCVNGEGLVARHRKLHAFVSPHLSSGNQFCTLKIEGWICSILICYDNNLPENVRATALAGAEIVFMPHVTGCLPSVMPGRGTVDPQLWANRHHDPARLRMELNGPKGRGWLMRFLPARAWENGVYAIFSNPIGMDYGQVRNGNAMILDPFGEVATECHALDDDFCIGVCTQEAVTQSSGRRYLRARRPELYQTLTAPSALPPLTEPGWQRELPAEGSGN